MSSAEPRLDPIDSVSAHQRLLLAHMDEGFAACEMLYDDAGEPCDYRFLEVNAAFEQQTGLHAADILDKTVLELFPDVERTWIERFGKVASTGVSERFENFSHNTGRYYETFAYSPEKSSVLYLIRDITVRKHAEQCVMQSETRLRLALEVGKLATWNSNYVTGEYLWDDAMVRLLGYQPGVKPSQEAWARRVHPEDLPHVMEKNQAAARLGGDFDYEYRIFSQRDEVRWVEVRGHADAGENGKIVRSYGVVLDITERKRDEQSLQEFADLLRLALSANQSGYFDRDISRGITRWSTEMAHLYGFDNGTFNLSQEQWRSCVLPEDLPATDASVGEAMRTGELRCEFRIVRQSDKQVRWIGARGKVLYDQQHNPIRLIGINTDITEFKHAEQALRVSEQEHAALADLVPQAVWKCLPDGSSIYFNQRWVDYTGLSVEESLGANWITPFHPDDRKTAADAWRHATSTGEPYIVESRLRAADGTYRRFLMRGLPQRDLAGNILNWYGTCTDIEDIMRAEDELRLTNQRFELALRNSPIAVSCQDLDLRYTWNYNPTGSLQPERILGKRDIDLFERGQDAAITETIKRNVIRSGVSRRQDVIVRAKGIDRCYDLTVDPQRDANGSIVGVRCATIDRTERKQAEIVLNAQRELTETVVEQIPCCVAFVRGHDLTLQLVNSAYQALAPDRKMIGKTIGEVWPEAVGFPDACRSVLATGKTSSEIDQPVTLGRTAGAVPELRYFTWSMHPVNLPGEEESGLLVSGWETTVRKRAEDALLRTEKLASVGRMAASIAHEINNPLAATTNLLFLAGQVAGLPETAREYLDLAQAELNRVAHYTRQSLGFYSESSGPVPTSLGPLLDSTVALFQAKIGNRSATVVRSWDSEFEITAVPGELRQIFSNLLANSLDAIDQKGTVRIKVSAAARTASGIPCVRVTIADNGRGIPATSRPQVFEPFFTTKGSVGTGLGLWVSKQLADKHRGRIQMRSSTAVPRRGTTFSITLPTDSAPTSAN